MTKAKLHALAKELDHIAHHLTELHAPRTLPPALERHCIRLTEIAFIMYNHGRKT